MLERQAELPCLRQCLAIEQLEALGEPVLPFGCATICLPPTAGPAFAVQVPAALPPAVSQFLIQRPSEAEPFKMHLQQSVLQVKFDAQLLPTKQTGAFVYLIYNINSSNFIARDIFKFYYRIYCTVEVWLNSLKLVTFILLFKEIVISIQFIIKLNNNCLFHVLV